MANHKFLEVLVASVGATTQQSAGADGVPHVRETKGLTFSWCSDEGFGQVSLSCVSKRVGGGAETFEWRADTECMDREFLRDLLLHIAATAVLEYDRAPKSEGE